MPNTSRDHRTPIALVAILLAVLAVHLPAVTFDFTNWDDDLYVGRNPVVTDPAGASWQDWLLTPTLGYPVPVTVATLAAERAVFGTGPTSHHAVNLGLHALAAVLVFGCVLALQRRFAGAAAGREGPGGVAPDGGAPGAGGVAPWLAAAAALLFALHPAAAEAVAWIPGRKDLLAAVFVLGALLAWLRLPAGDRRVLPRLGMAALLVAAMLSKPVAGVIPLLFLVADRRGRPAVWVATLAVTGALAGLAFHLEAKVGALEAPAGPDLVTRVLAGAWRHGLCVAWPLDLSPKYLDDPGGVPVPVLVGGAAFAMALVAGLGVASWRRSPAALGLGLAALAYGPVSGVVPLTRQYADSYVYLPLAGLVLAGAASAGPALARLAVRPRAVVGTAFAGLLAALAVTAAGQAAVYADGVSLWTEVYRRYPDSPQVCRNLGNAWMSGRRDDPATAARVYGHCIATLGNRDFFLKNLAIATWLAGDRDGARALFLEYRAAHPGDGSVGKYLVGAGER